MGLSIDVNPDNFTADVIERSHQQLVVVDFFARWCGPCQMLKPMLEKLVEEYDFTLAKVDIDEHPDLANTYHVEGVPDVRICYQGEMQPGFVGVLPEPQLRELLAQYGLQSYLDTELAAIQVARTAGEIEEVKQRFKRLIEQYPESPKLAIAAAEFLISIDRLDSAEKLIRAVSYQDREYYPRAQALQTLIEFKQEADQIAVETDSDRQFADAAQLTLKGEYEAALDRLLDLVRRDRTYKKDAARKAMLMIFGILGDDHPLTKDYRKQLMLALY